MNVLSLTIFVGSVLVSFFIGLFLHQTARERGTSERDALLPLAPEKPAPSGKDRRRSHRSNPTLP